MKETKRIEFFDYLKEDAASEEMRIQMEEHKINMPISFRRFLPLMFNEYALSIQGSGAHYCTPRETFENPSIYSTMEVAIMSRASSNFVDITSEPLFKDFHLIEVVKERKASIGVYATVPVEVIEQLFQYMKRVDKASE
jgi:hypothetical protein